MHVPRLPNRVRRNVYRGRQRSEAPSMVGTWSRLAVTKFAFTAGMSTLGLFSTQDVSGNRDPARPEQPVGSMCDRQLPPSGPPTRQGYAGVASADWRKGATSRETTAGFGPKIAPRFASERRNARDFQNRPFLALGPAYRRPHAQGYFVAGWRPPVAARSSRCDDLLGGGGANAASRKPLPHG